MLNRIRIFDVDVYIYIYFKNRFHLIRQICEERNNSIS